MRFFTFTNTIEPGGIGRIKNVLVWYDMADEEGMVY